MTIATVDEETNSHQRPKQTKEKPKSSIVSLSFTVNECDTLMKRKTILQKYKPPKKQIK